MTKFTKWLLISMAAVGVASIIACALHFIATNTFDKNFNIASNGDKIFGGIGIGGVVLIIASGWINHIISDKSK